MRRSHFSILCLSALTLTLAALPVLRADEAQILQNLTAKGAKVTDQRGVLGIEVPKPTEWTEADFKGIAQLTRVQHLSFGLGLTDAQLALLQGLPNVDTFGSNGANISDEGLKIFANFKKLQSLTFFHPGKAMTGTGFTALASLPALETMTVAGSSAFGNDGVAAVAQLSHLKSLRIFHTNADITGLAKLSALHNLTNLTLGQRLSYTKPVALSDETVTLATGFSNLQNLSFMEAELSLSALQKLKSLNHLKFLTLQGIQINSGDIEQLKSALNGVQIKYTAPDANGLKRIKALAGS